MRQSRAASARWFKCENMRIVKVKNVMITPDGEFSVSLQRDGDDAL